MGKPRRFWARIGADSTGHRMVESNLWRWFATACDPNTLHHMEHINVANMRRANKCKRCLRAKDSAR